MRRIRQRPRADGHGNQPRGRTDSWGRRVYVALLALLALFIGYHAVGDRLVLEAEGLVLRERTVVAPTSVSRVERVFVRPGQPVEAGDALLQTGSIELLSRIADLATRRAALAEREAQRRGRLTIVRDLIPLAEQRAAEVDREAAGLAALRISGLVEAGRLGDVRSDLHGAASQLASLTSEERALERELAAIDAAGREAAFAVENLEAHYGGGLIYAARAGSVGETVPAPGEVFVAGEAMLSVHSGRPYVLAYLPDRYLFGIEPGLRVMVRGGRVTAAGRVSELLPVSQALPPEFRNVYRPEGRRQLVRIDFDGDPPFPTFASVSVGRETSLAQAVVAPWIGGATKRKGSVP